jgi:hypothetical protein
MIDKNDNSYQTRDLRQYISIKIYEMDGMSKFTYEDGQPKIVSRIHADLKVLQNIINNNLANLSKTNNTRSPNKEILYFKPKRDDGKVQQPIGISLGQVQINPFDLIAS